MTDPAHDPHYVAAVAELLEGRLKEANPEHWFMLTPSMVPVGQTPDGERISSAALAVYVFRKSPVIGDGVLTAVDFVVDLPPMLDPAHIDKYVGNVVMKLATGASNRLREVQEAALRER